MPRRRTPGHPPLADVPSCLIYAEAASLLCDEEGMTPEKAGNVFGFFVGAELRSRTIAAEKDGEDDR